MEVLFECRSHKHLLTTHRGGFPRPSSVWSGGVRSPSGLLPGPGIARKSVPPPNSAVLRTGRFLVPPPLSRSIYWTSVVFVLLLCTGLFPEVPGRADPQLRKRPWPLHWNRGGMAMAMAWLLVGVCCFPFFHSSSMLYSVGPLSALPVKRSPAKRSCQPQPGGSRREAAPRKDTRQDCRSYVSWKSGLLFNFCTGAV